MRYAVESPHKYTYMTLVVVGLVIIEPFSNEWSSKVEDITYCSPSKSDPIGDASVDLMGTESSLSLSLWNDDGNICVDDDIHYYNANAMIASSHDLICSKDSSSICYQEKYDDELKQQHCDEILYILEWLLLIASSIIIANNNDVSW